MAGSEWSTFAQNAALKLINNIQEESVAMELLTDIREIIGNKNRITTEELLTALSRDKEKRWFTYERGVPITVRQLSIQLKLFGIQSKSIRIDCTIKKGYTVDQVIDAFNRYLPVLPVTTAQPNDYNDYNDFYVTESLSVPNK